MTEAPDRTDYLPLLKDAYLELRDLRSQLDDMERLNSEPIAIIGLGCRFPGGAANPSAFWEVLRNGVDAITEVLPSRWDIEALYDPDPQAPGKMYTRWGGFLDDVDAFDPHFFGIAPREAVAIDPQQRVLLEVSWEAIEDAGQSPAMLSSSPTGVFIAITSTDYAQISRGGGLAGIDAYFATGNAPAIAASRLSYLLGLRGPAMALDTACSSSLVALHLACQSLRSGECRTALAGGVNLILAPDTTVNFCKAQMLAPDGRCKTFDAAANGYVRSEGCGVLVLKRLSDAQAEGDNILAIVRASATNQDGRSAGITAPNGTAQEEVIRKALDAAQVEAHQVSYVETHGTGTSLGDPIEARALAAVFADRRPQTHPLMIGSVKTNIGHAEAAAGAASLIKVVLALQNKEIPPHLHLQQLSPYFEWKSSPLIVPTTPTPWPDGAGRRIAGVSGFGFSGTNAHVILEEAPPREPETSHPERPYHLLTLSAKTQTALSQLAASFASRLEDTTAKLGDVCFTANTGRARFAHRLALVARSSAQAAEQMADVAAGRSASGILLGRADGTKAAKVAFMFSGEPWRDIEVRRLYDTEPAFREMMDRCDQVLRPYLPESLLTVLNPDAGVSDLAWEPQYRHLAVLALECSAAELWRSWGVEATAVVGVGGGEFTAAWVAGLFDLVDGLKLAAEQAPLRWSSPGTADGALDRGARQVRYQPLRLPFLSGSAGRVFRPKESPELGQWGLDNEERVGLDGGMQTLLDEGRTVFLQMGPTLARKPNGEMSWPDGTELLPGVGSGHDEGQAMLRSAASLFTKGVELHWSQLGGSPPRRRVPLPTYPFERESYWVQFSEGSTAPSVGSIPARGAVAPSHGHLGLPVRLAQPRDTFVWECELDKQQASYLGSHSIQGQTIVPVATYIELAETATQLAFGEESHVLEDLELGQALFLSEAEPLKVQVILSPSIGGETVFSVYGQQNGGEPGRSWTLHATAKVRKKENPA